MKAIAITLRQCADQNKLTVVRLSNTTQLAIGQIVTRERVTKWLELPRVTVQIVGITETETEQKTFKL